MRSDSEMVSEMEPANTVLESGSITHRYKFPSTLTKRQKSLLDKISRHCSKKKQHNVEKTPTEPVMAVLTLDEFEQYFRSTEEAYKTRITGSRKQEAVQLFKGCREIYLSVLKGVECMQSSFSTINIALSHTKCVAEDLKDRFYDINSEMNITFSILTHPVNTKNSLLKVIEDIDTKLSRYSKFSDIKKFFDKPHDIIENDKNLIDMIRSLKNFHEGVGRDVQLEPPKKYTGGSFSCMLVAMESISLHVCKVLNGINEAQDVDVAGMSKEEMFVNMIDTGYSKFLEARESIGELLGILCEETKLDPRFVQCMNECISAYNISIMRLFKLQSIERRLRNILSDAEIDKSVAKVFACILCLESRRRSLQSMFFEGYDSPDTSGICSPPIIKKHIRHNIANINNFDMLSRIYLNLKAFLSYPDDELDSKSEVLDLLTVLKKLTDPTISSLPMNQLSSRFLDVKAFCTDKLMATAYEYASSEIQSYRMNAADVLLFVIKPPTDTESGITQNVFGELQAMKTHKSTSKKLVELAPQITHDLEVSPGKIGRIDIKHLRKPKPGNGVAFGQGLNYPTVQHTVYVLRKIHDAVGEEVYGKFGEHIIHDFFSSLTHPSEIISKRESLIDASLFVISNCLSVYEDLCTFMIRDTTKNGGELKNNTTPLEKLEQGIASALSSIITNFVPNSGAVVERLIKIIKGGKNSKTPKASNPQELFSASLERIVKDINTECNDAFRKIKCYISDAIIAKKIAGALVNKLFASIKTLEDAVNDPSEQAVLMDAKDKIRDFLLERLEFFDNSYSQSPGESATV